MDRSLNNYATSPTKEGIDSAPEPQPNRTSDSSPGSRPLSWQRRPASRSPDKLRSSRPLSIVATENAAARTPVSPEPSSTSESTMSRDQIAQSLSGKDPAWFRQTRDRGLSSPAYRRSQVEDEDRSDVSSRRSQLPGMTSSSSAENPAPAPAPLRRSKTGGSILDSPRLGPAADIEPRSPERSPSRADGRMSPNRPASPTKGMGGFVQSAMMKRSDSVKRWSVASPPGLARADSVRSNRGSISERAGIASQPNTRSRPASMIRDGSTTPTRLRHGSEDRGGIEPASVADPTPDTMSNLSASAEQRDEKTTPPTSPSKTMDPRRWSPTKSSWLESALNKPESPKPKPAPAPSNQPAWMVELNKAKAQKANNPDSAIKAEPPSHKHEVRIGGLMRPDTSGVAKKTISPGVSSPSLPTTSTERPTAAGLKSPLEKPASPSPTSPVLPAAAPPPRGPANLESKPKPEASSKVDFRGNLKPRQPPPASGSQSGNVNELASVFSSLRKTKTQNYVAPDELKGNILRGKAALNVTGGPKKTERKDEFKEAILQKKEEFKKAQAEGSGVKTSLKSSVENPVPEGLAKRNELGRSATVTNRESVSSDSTRAASTLPSNRESLATDTTGISSAITSPSFKSAQTPVTDTVPENEPTQLTTAREAPVTSPVAAPKETGATPRGPGRIGGSLADRFNPGLAGILARGPPAASTSKPTGSSPQSPSKEPSDASGGPQLTHVTKTRARGPRRKAPSSAAPASAPKSSAPAPTQAQPSSTPASSDQTSPTDSSKMSSSMTSTTAGRPSQIQLVDSTPANPVDQVRLVDSSSMSPSYNQSYSPYSRRKDNENSTTAAPGQIKLVDSSAMREAYAAATPTRERGGSISGLSFAGTPTREARGSYSSGSSMKGSIASQVAASAAQRSSPLTPRSPEAKNEEPKEEPPSPRKLDMKRRSRFLDEAQQSPASEPVRDPLKRQSRPSSPVKAPEQAESTVIPRPLSRPLPSPPQVTSGSSTKALPQPPSPDKDLPAPPSGQGASVKSAAAMFGSGAATTPNKEQAPTLESPQGFRSRPRSPTKVEPPSSLTLNPKSPERPPSPMRSPTRQAMETSQLLTDFFGPQRPRREYRADAAEILMRRPPTGQDIKPLSTQRLQIFGDGKMVPVPAHNDRVLFEREMYVCSHVFTNGSNKKVTEVYFWVGDEVPETAVRGAEAIAAKEARSIGGRFAVLRQGKETPEFLMALGGVVLTRRGSSNKYDSLAPNMLCGRRYMGCVAFDEVDFAPSSLCSGFPYLITQQGQCHLWKGRGSDGEELDSARLVGMDLSLTGRLEEVDDGEEPAGFWDVFDGGEKGVSADHWRLKPGYSKYCCRLFCSEAESKQQVSRILTYYLFLITTAIHTLTTQSTLARSYPSLQEENCY